MHKAAPSSTSLTHCDQGDVLISVEPYMIHSASKQPSKQRRGRIDSGEAKRSPLEPNFNCDTIIQEIRRQQRSEERYVLGASHINSKFKLRMEKQQVLETAQASIRYAKKYFSKVEFSLEDAGRTELDFMAYGTS